MRFFMGRRGMAQQVLLSIAMLILVGCDLRRTPGSGSSTDELQQKLMQHLEELMKDPQLPVKEIEKLQQREYAVVKVDLNASTQKMEGALNEFGKNRWDCFHAEKMPPAGGEQAGSLLFFCKRLPETPLRFIPHSIIGR